MSDSGTFPRFRASSLEMIRSPSNSKPGRARTALPVARITLFASIARTTLPSTTTSTERGEASRPKPRTDSTPFRFRRPSTPFAIWPTTPPL